MMVHDTPSRVLLLHRWGYVAKDNKLVGETVTEARLLVNERGEPEAWQA